jgi:hypothetical protein
MVEEIHNASPIGTVSRILSLCHDLCLQANWLAIDSYLHISGAAASLLIYVYLILFEYLLQKKSN